MNTPKHDSLETKQFIDTFELRIDATSSSNNTDNANIKNYRGRGRKCSDCAHYDTQQRLCVLKKQSVAPDAAIAEMCQLFEPAQKAEKKETAPAEKTQDKPPAPVPEKKKEEKRSVKRGALYGAAKQLYDCGFNVVPVDSNKKPLARWSTEKRLEWSRLKTLLEKAEGIAVAGGKNYMLPSNTLLVIIDVDNPAALEKSATLKSLLEKTVCYKTGPRCPSCNGKHLEIIEYGKLFKCKACGKQFSVAEAKRGYGLLVIVSEEDAEKFNLKTTKRLGDVEFLVNNYQLVPPSVHPSGVQYEWIKAPSQEGDYGIYQLKNDELRALLAEIEKKDEEGESRKTEERKELRELRDSELLELKEIVKRVYEPGIRQKLWLYVSGWFAWVGVHYTSAAKLLKMLFDESGDTDDIKTRGAAIVYSYVKRGYNVDKKIIASILGAEPYGPEKIEEWLSSQKEKEEEGKEIKVAGRGLLLKTLTEKLGEAEAQRMVERVERILGKAMLEEGVRAWVGASRIYVADPVKKSIYLLRLKERRDKEGNVETAWYIDRIIIRAFPFELKYVKNAWGGEPVFEAEWETRDGRKSKVRGSVEEHLEELRKMAVVTCKAQAEDALSAIFDEALHKGVAEKIVDYRVKGFYAVEGNVKTDDPASSGGDTAKLRSALETLNSLAAWYPTEVLGVVLKWLAVAPLSFVLKAEAGKYIPMLVLHGLPGSGKTTLAMLACWLWDLDEREYVNSVERFRTPARMARVFGTWTYPVLIDNASSIFTSGGETAQVLRDMLKTAVESPRVRGRYAKSVWVDDPALASVILTIDTSAIQHMDTAERRRSVLANVTPLGWTPEKVKEFNEKYGEKGWKLRSSLKEIGYWLRTYFNGKNISELAAKTWEELSIEAWSRLYTAAGMEPPAWLKAEVKPPEEVLAEARKELAASIIETTHQIITDLTLTYLGREKLDALTTLKERLEALMSANIPCPIVINGDKVYFTRKFLDELANRKIGVTSLKDLAELMGWEYKATRIRRLNMAAMVAIAPLEALEQEEQ